MMVVFRHTMEAVLNPFFILWFGLVCCIIGLFVQGYRAYVFPILFTIIILLTVFSTGFVPKFLTSHLEQQYARIKAPDEEIHFVVVLGGGQFESGNYMAHDLLTSASIKRLMEGIWLYRNLPRAKLVLSGGGYGANTPEARRLLQLSSTCQIPRAEILIEQNSTNTSEQAQALRPILNKEPFYLVTSAIHMPRAMRLFQAQGMHPRAAPTDFTHYWDDERWQKIWIPNPQNLLYISIAWHELLGRVWAGLRGQI